MPKRQVRWARRLLPVALGAVLFQQGCALDPDLLLQAAVQFITEFAIFVTDNVIVGLR
ncbi:MAG: hypothetical protein U1D55_00660 [Phycisphaerae bacterium]